MLLHRNRPQFAVDCILENHMQMGIGFVYEKDRRRAGMKESKQHQDLLKSAPGTGDVQLFLSGRMAILRKYIGSRLIRRNKFISK